MRRKKESISLQEFALTLVDRKFENDFVTKQFNRLCEGIERRDDKSSSTRFLEYLIFDLFTDNACFLLAFSQEVSRLLFTTYSINILVRLLGKGYKVEPQEFDVLFEKRAIEYHQYLQEFDAEYIKKKDINKCYLAGLGKAFSMNLVGYVDPVIMSQANHMFISKLEHIYGEFLRHIVEKYEISVGLGADLGHLKQTG
jgi:hypothetical protein